MGTLFSTSSPPRRRNLDAAIVNSIARSLNEIQNIMNGINENRDIWITNLREWKESRRRTLSVIQKCQDELDTIHVYSSAGKVLGAAATVFGIVTSGAGAVMTFYPGLQPIGDQLMKYGPIVSGGGGVATIISYLSEKGFSAIVLRELGQALKEDQRLTAVLLPWFRRAAELENLFQEVFDCSLVDTIIKIFSYLRQIVKFCNEGANTISEILDVLSSLASQDTFSAAQAHLRSLNNAELEAVLSKANSKVITLLLGFFQSPKIENAMITLYTTFIESPDLFEIPKVSNCIVTEIIEEGSALCGVNFLTSGSLSINWTQGMFPAIIVVLNVFTIISAAKDLREGKSKYSELITQIISCLSRELEILESNPLLSR